VPPPLTLVHASMADKDVDGIIAALCRSDVLAAAHVVATQVPGERAMPAGELAARWRAARPGAMITTMDDLSTALGHALATARRPVVVAGSLYLVGEARRRWLDDPLLADPPPSGPPLADRPLTHPEPGT
jgi:folylpolyglutamate synthase/dihydropteroate synthase